MKRLEALDFDTLSTKIVLLDKDTQHTLTIRLPEAGSEDD